MQMFDHNVMFRVNLRLYGFNDLISICLNVIETTLLLCIETHYVVA